LYRLEGSPDAPAPQFTDVPGDSWYYAAVCWAAQNGITMGVSDTEFAPNQTVTREQIASLLMRYVAYTGQDTSARADLSGYMDASTVSAWALDGMMWAKAAGLVNGVTDTQMAPQGTATRAQVATILARYIRGIEAQQGG
ncbi:MAG: S-layer homology domain-containing protein, partial [Firmicutes bacterium]|nr:S-layer homology domain-containing protein [Bacillota bacterium]